VRKRFDELNTTNNPQHCVWTQPSLAIRQHKKSNVQIVHCFPFARWPNNDLWNLLPTDVKANGEKSDRLPTAQRMNNAKEPITDWWQSTWLDNQDTSLNANISRQFFAQVNIALPGLNSNNTSIDDLFEAMEVQRDRLKEMQQLREW
jgi:hypothetical protein